MKQARRLVLISASALTLPLAFPPVGWWPLVLVSLTLLVLATTRTTPRAAFYLGLLQGTVGYGLALHWFFVIFAAPALVLFLTLGLFTAFFCYLNNRLAARATYSPGWQILLTAVLWTALEFFRAELFFLRFPWITPGTALGPTVLSPWLGVYAASLLVALAAAGLARRDTLPLGTAATLAVCAIVVLRPGPLPSPAGGFTVALIQSEDCVLDFYADLTREAAPARPQLVVWPEYALPYDVRTSPGDMNALHRLCTELDTLLLVGTQTRTGPEPHEWRNTALLINQQNVLAEYFKARPVHFFNDGIPGDRLHPLPSPLGPVGTPICFDVDYTAVCRTLAANGAAFFAVPSFDAVSWSAWQHWQHAAFFRLRAAENQRWLVCAASSGVTQIIDPHGHVQQHLPPFAPGVLTGRIAARSRLTFYTRYGWLFPWLTLVSAVAGLSLTVRQALRQHPEHIETPHASSSPHR